MLQQSEFWTGRITIATGVRMLIEEVGTALRAFQRRHPDVSICIRQSDSRDAEPLVATGQVDMALTLEPGPGYAGRAVTRGEVLGKLGDGLFRTGRWLV